MPLVFVPQHQRTVGSSVVAYVPTNYMTVGQDVWNPFTGMVNETPTTPPTGNSFPSDPEFERKKAEMLRQSEQDFQRNVEKGTNLVGKTMSGSLIGGLLGAAALGITGAVMGTTPGWKAGLGIGGGILGGLVGSTIGFVAGGASGMSNALRS